MPSVEHTNVPPSTVDQTSAGSPSCTCGNTSLGQNPIPARTFLDDFDFGPPEGVDCPDFPFTDRSPSPHTVQALRECSQDTAAGEPPVRNNRSEWGGGGQGVKTELPPAVTNISDSCMTRTAPTRNTRNSKGRPVPRRNDRSGVAGRRVGMTNAKTRSQTAEEREGTSITGGSTAIGPKNDVGQKVITEDKL